MIENKWYKKEQPLFTMSGLGGGSFREVLSALAQVAGFRSLRFDPGDTASANPYLTRTPSSAGNRKTYTWSGWLKSNQDGSSRYIFGTNDHILMFRSSTASFQISDGSNISLRTERAFRDFSAWFHLVVSVDTTQAVTTDRVKIYVNGSQVTNFVSGYNTYPDQNFDTNINTTVQHSLGTFGTAFTTYNWRGYLADVNFLDGIAASPTAFGAYDSYGVWQRSEYDGSYGTNGFKLTFNDSTDTTTIGKDSSGQGNDLTSNNITVSGTSTDVLLDFPSNDTKNTDSGVGGEILGNYATLNMLEGNLTLSNGNLQSDRDTSSWASNRSTIAVSSGKWYFEFTPTAGSGTHYMQAGVYKLSGSALNNDPSSQADGYIYNAANGKKYNNNSSASYGNSWAVGDTIGVALDLDGGNLYFYKNGTIQNSGTAAYTGLSGTFTAVVAQYGTCTIQSNFGQRAFTHAAPSGYKCLNSASLPTPTIADGSQYFDTKLYTGNGGTQSITGLDFSPDFAWIKQRNNNGAHMLFDSVRGATKRLVANQNLTEGTVQGVTSFDSAGFSLGNDADCNMNNINHVAWTWDAGSSTVTNTDGSISSQVRASQTAGFSILTYTGDGSGTDTIGHGLNDAPSLVITKSRGTTGSWRVFTDVGGTWKLGNLNNTDAFVNATVSAPTSSVFSIDGNSNASTTHVAYCFAPVPGFSAMGSYIGNASDNGPFVFCGFKPRWIMMKNTETGGSYYDWRIIDTARHTYNHGGNADIPPTLFANKSDAELDWDNVDILSNGFKIRDSSVSLNENNKQQFFLAFAENPFQANGGLAR